MFSKPCPRAGKPQCLGVITAGEPRILKRLTYCSRPCAAQRNVKVRPLCQCGCGEHVKGMDDTFKHGHVPMAVRQANGRKGRAAAAYRHRRRRFEAVFAEMVADGRTLTKEGILEAFAAVDRAAFSRGWHAYESKSQGRTFASNRPLPPQRYRERHGLSSVSEERG